MCRKQLCYRLWAIKGVHIVIAHVHISLRARVRRVKAVVICVILGLDGLETVNGPAVCGDASDCDSRVKGRILQVERGADVSAGRLGERSRSGSCKGVLRYPTAPRFHTRTVIVDSSAKSSIWICTCETDSVCVIGRVIYGPNHVVMWKLEAVTVISALSGASCRRCNQLVFLHFLEQIIEVTCARYQVRNQTVFGGRGWNKSRHCVLC